MLDNDPHPTRIFRYRLKSDDQKYCEISLVSTVAAGQRDVNKLKKGKYANIYTPTTLEVVLDMWKKFWLEVDEVQTQYSECRLTVFKISQDLRYPSGFAPLTCVFSDARSQKELMTKGEVLSPLVLGKPPPGRSQNGPVMADTHLPLGCLTQTVLWKSESCNRLSYLPYNIGPSAVLDICAQMGGVYAGLAHTLRVKGDSWAAYDSYVLWCCHELPVGSEETQIDRESCRDTCAGGFCAGKFVESQDKAPRAHNTFFMYVEKVHKKNLEQRAAKLRAAKNWDLMRRGLKNAANMYKASEDFLSTAAMPQADAGPGAGASFLEALAEDQLSPSPTNGLQMEATNDGEGGGRARQGFATTLVAAGLLPPGSDTYGWDCPATPRFEEQRTGGCWPCKGTISAKERKIRCWKTADKKEKAELEAARKFVEIKNEIEWKFLDQALEESALRAVDYGFAPLDAHWFTCDEGLLKNPDTGADEYMGGVMCWVGHKQDTGSRGCHHWVVPPPAQIADEDTWSKGQQYNWTRCEQHYTCDAPKDSLVKYVMQKNSDETESLFRLIPVARSFKCEASFFGYGRPAVSAHCLIGVPAELPQVEAEPREPTLDDSGGDTPEEEQSEDDKHDDSFFYEDMKGVRIAPMDDARTGDAAYLYLFDKYHSTYMSQKRPMAECAEPPGKLEGERNTVEVV
eukprot:TRINITY_DN7335_c0_g2_i1.p1 TRINITY_DN7335_c0_g2~~TRINITY_DN7335_c0_g2_i1.p1  ORF type:complete len:787 (-),score=148.14 TRINITY_DN7335_c0_g2_i1:58-2106(-)